MDVSVQIEIDGVPVSEIKDKQIQEAIDGIYKDIEVLDKRIEDLDIDRQQLYNLSNELEWVQRNREYENA